MHRGQVTDGRAAVRKKIGTVVSRCSLALILLLLANLPFGQLLAANNIDDLVSRYQRLSLAEKEAVARQYGVSRAEIEAQIAVLTNKSRSEKKEEEIVVLEPVENGRPKVQKAPNQTQARTVFPKDNNSAPSPGASDSDLWAGLIRFGSQLFDPEVSSFAVSNNLPVSEDYLLGVGDEVHVQLIGNEASTLMLPVQRDGSIVFPRIGKIIVSGLTFKELKNLLTQRVNDAFVGTTAITTLGPLRKINVFAAGAVTSPGNHAVLSTTTLMQMLFIVGGPAELGSFRHIEVHRSGKLLTSIDLYDLLLSGKLAEDIRLHNGDVLFIPTMGPTVGIRGRVRRPAKYEMREGETLNDAMRMADGLLPDALMVPAILRRRLPNTELPTLVDVDLRDQGSLNIPVFDGDLLTVAQLPARYVNPLKIAGAVEHPGLFAWVPGVRISHFFPSVHGRLKEGADLDVGLIMRRRADRQSVDVFSFSPGDAIRKANTKADPILRPHDEVFILDDFSSRTKLLGSVVKRLETQSTIKERPRTVTVRGAVADPGVFPLAVQQTVSDLIELGGGSRFLDLDVDMDIAVIVRRDPELVNKFEVIPFRLDLALKERHTDADPLLQPMDELLVLSETNGDGASNRREILRSVVERFERQATLVERAQIVQVVGEVREPGYYPILNTLNVQHLIELAGGFTEAAYTKVAEVHRMKLSENEVLTTDILTISLEDKDATNQALISRDVLRVNRNPGWHETRSMTISGEVKFPGTYALRPGEKLSEVLKRVGGLTPEAFVQGAVFTSAVSEAHHVRRVGHYFTYLSKGALVLDSNESDEFESVQVLRKLVEAEVSGRVVVDLEGILNGDPDADIVVQSGDTLMVPQSSQLVSVVGEVFVPGDFTFREGRSIADYIENAGGLTRFSEAKRAYVIRADGSITSIGKKGIMRKRWRGIQVEPGDTIVVPVDLAYETGLARLATFSRVAFESIGSIGILLNASKSL